jgi:hypothetical protein
MRNLRLPLKPATETALGELGRAVELLFSVDEPDVARDARSLYRRLQPDVTKNQRLLSAVPRLVRSLLSSLDLLAPKHGVHRQTITMIWAAVEKTLDSQATTARSQPG